MTKLENLIIFLLFLGVFISFSCMPDAGEITSATDSELDRACRSLRSVGYDYWKLNALEVGGRTVEVAADIHMAHPGPKETREYCENR